MGHMAVMAEICKLAATLGLVKEETSEERDAWHKHLEKRDEYLKFWIKAYKNISDENAIKNFEYALEDVCKSILHCRYGVENVHSTLKYPSLHCEALAKTHPTVICSRARELQHEAFYGKGRYVRPDVSAEERMRICHMGYACNNWLSVGRWSF